VSVEGETVTSPVSPLVTLTTTSDVGAAFKTVVNVAVVPDSLVLPETEPKDIPGVEPLKLVIEKSSTFNLSPETRIILILILFSVLFKECVHSVYVVLLVLI